MLGDGALPEFGSCEVSGCGHAVPSFRPASFVQLDDSIIVEPLENSRLDEAGIAVDV